MTRQLIIFCRRDRVAGLVVMCGHFHLRHSEKDTANGKRDFVSEGICGGVCRVGYACVYVSCLQAAY